MTLVQGAYRGTGNIESTILARDIQRQILQYDQNLTPLLVLAANMGGAPRVTVNPKFEWYEEDREVRRDTSTTTGTGTTLTVGDFTQWNAGEIWRNTRTGEGFRVTTTPTTSSVTVTRNLDASGAVACVSGDEYLKIGTAKMEGDVSLAAHSGNPTQKFNYTQIFERTYAMTATAQNTNNYTDPQDWYWRARRAMQEFKLDKEASYLWGPGAGIDSSGAHPQRYTRGVHPSITTNKTDFGGTMTEAEFFDKFDTAFRYGSDSKFALCGRQPINVISGFPRGKLETIQADQDTTYGLAVRKFRHAHGDLNILTHNLFGDSTSTYFSQVLILDMAGSGGNDSLVREVYLQNRDTNIAENVQEPDRDGRKDRIYCESGIQLGLEKSHSLWSNVNA
jgi:hypothetical protein